jgi:DNA modification methylase
VATTTTDNTLYYGDNLDILREYISTESVDLVYLDPPLNSNRNYNILFEDESGKDSKARKARQAPEGRQEAVGSLLMPDDGR